MFVKKFCIFLLVILLFFGCSETEEKSNENLKDAVGDSKKPPGLSISTNDLTINPILGSYDWTYFDNEEGTMTGIESDSVSPPKFFKNANCQKVNSSTNVELNFEEQPKDYKVKIWDDKDRVINTYENVVLKEIQGKAIYEVMAEWKKGKASYVFCLNIN